MSTASSCTTRRQSKARIINSADVLANIAAVEAGLKPSYLFDRAFLPSDSVSAWLIRINDQLRPNCYLSVLDIESQVFVVDVVCLRNYLLDIISESKIGARVLIDISCDLQQPRVKRTADSNVIIKQCAEVDD